MHQPDFPCIGSEWNNVVLDHKQRAVFNLFQCRVTNDYTCYTFRMRTERVHSQFMRPEQSMSTTCTESAPKGLKFGPVVVACTLFSQFCQLPRTASVTLQIYLFTQGY